MSGASARSKRRADIIERDNFTCYLCHRRFKYEQLAIDHIIPQGRGGTNARFNLAAACEPCNHRKGDNLLSELDWVDDRTLRIYSTLKRERGRNRNRVIVLCKRVELAVYALFVTPEYRIESALHQAKRR